MNVLSLFDGMSCGQIALNRLGVKIENYFASEIEINPITVTMKNFPNTKQLGDVTKVSGDNLPQIDLLIGGSPCQDLSLGNTSGEGLDGERSGLFWEYLKILKQVKPKYFLLENVVMLKTWEDVISSELGVQPIEINSSLVSAQNRKRLYWTNIPNITLPKDKGITLQSILSDGITDKEKGYCLTLHTGTIRDYFKKSETNIVYQPNENGKYEVKNGKISMTFPKGKNPNEIFTFNSRVSDGKYDFRKLTVSEMEKLQTVPDGYTQCVSYGHSMKALGNGWTVDVITHILKEIKN